MNQKLNYATLQHKTNTIQPQQLDDIIVNSRPCNMRWQGRSMSTGQEKRYQWGPLYKRVREKEEIGKGCRGVCIKLRWLDLPNGNLTSDVSMKYSFNSWKKTLIEGCTCGTIQYPFNRDYQVDLNNYLIPSKLISNSK